MKYDCKINIYNITLIFYFKIYNDYFINIKILLNNYNI